MDTCEIDNFTQQHVYIYMYIMFAIYAWCKTRVLLIGFVEYRFIFRRSHSYCYGDSQYKHRAHPVGNYRFCTGGEWYGIRNGSHALSEPIFTFYSTCFVAFTYEQFHKICSLVYNMCSDYIFDLITTSPRGQWVNVNITKLQNKTDAYSVAYCAICRQGEADGYRQTSNISRTSVGNKIVDHSDVVLQQHLNFLPGFNGLDKDNCKTRREAFKFWYLAVWRYIHLTSPHRFGLRNITKRTKKNILWCT